MMSDQEELADEFCMMLRRRLRKLSSDGESSGECTPKKIFRHYDMILELLAKAEEYKRDFLADVLRLVGIYYSYGSNNLSRYLQDFTGTEERKQRLIDMIEIYDILDRASPYESNPTLARIAEAFPQVSLVMASEINSNPYLGLKLWVSDRDLGVRVHYLFKLTCFPGMIFVDSGLKAQACLFLFTLCHAKALSNMHTSDKNIVSSFITSCKYSTNLMIQRLAPLQSRHKFTEYIEAIAPTAELLHRVWITLIGEKEIPLIEATAVTLLHEKVLRAQPQYLSTWKKLLNEKER